MTHKKLDTQIFDGVVLEGQVCSKCASWKPKEAYSKESRKKIGIRSICKACQSNDDKKYREENKEKVSERGKEYYKNNKDKIMEYRTENKERYDAYYEKYREDNREVIREKDRIYRRNTYDEKKQKYRDYYWKNRDKLISYNKTYYTSNKERFRLAERKRKARKKHMVNDLTAEQQSGTLDIFKGCALTTSTDFHWDHIIPLVTGHGGTTYGNMIPLRSDLNLSKSDTNLFEWFESSRQRFNLSEEKFNTLIAWLADINGVTVEEYREYVYWCHDNPHCLEDLREDDEGEAI